MQGLSVGRRQGHFAALWSMALLLQQFHTVILLELGNTTHQLRGDKVPTDADGVYTDTSQPPEEDSIPGNCSRQGLLNLTSTVSLLLREHYSENVAKILDLMPSCNSFFEKHLEHFWHSQALFRPMYPIIPALLYSVSGCPREVEQHLVKAVEELGCELTEDALRLLLELLDDASQSDDTEPDNSDQGDCRPNAAQILDDPNEQDAIDIKTEILSKNLLNLGELSNLMGAYLEATEESDRKELLENIQDLTSSMKENLAEEQEWAKSNINCVKPADMDDGEEEVAKNATLSHLKDLNISHIRHSSVIIDLPQTPDSFTTNSTVEPKNSTTKWDSNTKGNRQKRNAPPSRRSAREVHEDDGSLIYRRQYPRTPDYLLKKTSPLFFLKLEGECKLLTTECKTHLVKEEYSDLIMHRQLWLWTDNDTLNNIHSQVSITVNFVQCNGTGSKTLIPEKGCIFIHKQDGLVNPNLSAMTWKLVPFSTKEDHLQDVVCPFFIKTNSFPCLLLTETDGLMVHALTFDLDYPETQLWRWSQGRLINYFSELAMEAAIALEPRSSNQLFFRISQSTSFYVIPATPKDRWEKDYDHQLWQTDGANIQSRLQPDINLDLIRTEGDISFSLLNISANGWSFLDALRKDNQIAVTECVQMFFIKVNALPCHLLTAQDTEVKMQPYSQSNVLHQLWFSRGDRLINIANGLALGFREPVNRTSVRAELLSQDDLPDHQKWDMDNLVSWQEDPDCLLYVNNTDHRIQVVCHHDLETPFLHWDWVEFGSGFSSMDKIQCQFFIKSSNKACSVVTGFTEMAAVQLRPARDQLFHLQVWHWEGDHIIHTTSGLHLTALDNGTDKGHLTLNTLDPFKQQQWRWSDGYIMPTLSQNRVVTSHGQTNLMMDISLKSNDNELFQKWEFVNSRDASKTDTFLNCSAQNHSTFFIKNTLKPCMLLTGTPEGERPQFRHYDSTAGQLWSWDENQLVNVQSGLGLQLSDSGEPVMSATLPFEDATMWNLNKGVLRSEDQSCSLTSTLSCSQPDEHQWEVIVVDNVWEDLEDIVCLYFIQSQQSPCDLLTGFSTNESVKVRPVVDELLESQLWYWNGARIINAKTGLMLGLLDQDDSAGVILTKVDAETEKITWEYNGKHITTLNKTLTINPEGAIIISTPSLHSIKMWTLIRKEEALKNPQVLHCEVLAPKTLYYIKNSAYPCKLLTARDKGQSPHFKNFEEDNMNLQLWYKDGGHLVNVETNLAVHLQPQDIGSPSVVLWDKYTFTSEQLWEEQGNILRSKGGSNCTLTMDSDNQASCSPYAGSKQQTWTFVNNNASLEDFVCLYFIRNQHEACEYLTGYSKGSPALLRPLVDELLENQLWYWDGSHITNAKTDLVLHKNGWSVNLHEKTSKEDSSQLWRFQESEISLLFQQKCELLLDVNTLNNGQIYVSCRRNQFTQQWVFVEMANAKNDPELLFCSKGLPEQPEERDLFFLKNNVKACDLLTASEIDEMVEFKTFDRETPRLQLWYWNKGHLMNLGTGLALQPGDPAVLSLKMSFANRQKWVETGNQIRSHTQPECSLALTSHLGKDTVVLSCDATAQLNQWEKVPLDKNMDNLDEVICTFYIKNNLEPYDLLTAFNKGEAVRVSPWNPQLNQLWYWEGHNLVSVETNWVLRNNDHNTVILGEKQNEMSQQKLRMNSKDHGYIEMVGTGLVLDLSYSTVKVATKADRQSQKWTLVPWKKGAENQDLLHSAQQQTSTVTYFLKNEQDPCHLLTQVQGEGLSLQELNVSNSENQLWLRDKDHILNAVSHKAISAKPQSASQYSPVSVETKFSFDPYQKWQTQGQLIMSCIRCETLVLVSEGEGVILQSANGQEAEKWTWLTLQDVEDDYKLVARCSRCYDKGEEKAAEIIGYIPFLSLFYNLVRASVYAGKSCNKVALDSLKDAAIDVALDVGMAVVTVATAGTASSVMLGIKTGVKFGAKAGAKALGQALKASAKLGFHSIKTSLKTVIKQGIKKTTKQALKSSVKSVVGTVTSIKHLTIRTSKGLRKVTIKSYKVGQKGIQALKSMSLKGQLKVMTKSLTKASFKKATSNIGRSIKVRSKALGRKLRALGDDLAAEAERKIKLLDEIEAKKGKKVRRCKRMLNLSCNMDTTKKNKGDTRKENKGDTQKEDKGDTRKEDKGDTKKKNKGDTRKENKGDTQKEDKGDTTKKNKGDTGKENKGDTQKEDKGDTTKKNKGDTRKENKGDTQKEDKTQTKKTKKNSNSNSKKKSPGKIKEENDQKFLSERMGVTSENIYQHIYNKYKRIDADVSKQLYNTGKMTNDQNILDTFKEMKKNYEGEKHTVATPRQHSYYYTKSDDHTLKLQEGVSITETGLNAHSELIHTELKLSKGIDDTNLPFDPHKTDVYWYTKNSPCLTPSGQGEDSCVMVILKRCKEWFQSIAGKKCYVAFDSYWGFNGKKFDNLKLPNNEAVDQNVYENIFKEVLYGGNNKGLGLIKGYETFADYVTFIKMT